MPKFLYSFALTAALTVSAAGATSLVYGAPGEPISLDSGTIVDFGSTLAQMQVYDTLVKFKKGTSDLAPGLAINWKPNADSTVWTFTLRPGVKFSDGTPADADAVVYNVNRWWNPAAEQGSQATKKLFPSWQFIFGAYKTDPANILKSVQAVGTNKVVFTLTRPFAPLPAALATSYFGIASPTAIKKAGAKYGTPTALPVGSGPFIIQSWNTGDRMTFVPNKKYWGTKAKYDQLILRFIKDPSARLNELKSGNIDFTADLNPDQLGAIKADKNLNDVLIPSFNVGVLSLNYNNKYLKNDKVRQAISLAINKKAIVDSFWNGLGVSNASILPPALKWADSSSVPADYKYDPAAAKKLLAEAGYPSGFTLDLWYMPVSRPYFPTPKPIAEAMAADLGSIGIKVNLKTEDWAKYLDDRHKDPGFDMYMIGWTGPYASPYNFYNIHWGAEAGNDINYTNPTIAKLIEKAGATSSQGAQAKIYAQLHKMTYDLNLRIPIVHARPLAATRTYVKGWQPGPSVITPFEDITLEGK